MPSGEKVIDAGIPWQLVMHYQTVTVYQDVTDWWDMNLTWPMEADAEFEGRHMNAVLPKDLARECPVQAVSCGSDYRQISTCIMDFFPTTALLGVVLVLLVMVRSRGIGSRLKGYPPGPPTLPVIGNLHQMPKTQPHLQFKKWADEYGQVWSYCSSSSVSSILTMSQPHLLAHPWYPSPNCAVVRCGGQRPLRQEKRHLLFSAGDDSRADNSFRGSEILAYGEFQRLFNLK